MNADPDQRCITGLSPRRGALEDVRWILLIRFSHKFYLKIHHHASQERQHFEIEDFELEKLMEKALNNVTITCLLVTCLGFIAFDSHPHSGANRNGAHRAGWDAVSHWLHGVTDVQAVRQYPSTARWLFTKLLRVKALLMEGKVLLKSCNLLTKCSSLALFLF